MVTKAKEMGMPALGLTDHGTIAGIIVFLKECRAQGIKPILGVEAYLCRDHHCHSKDGQPDGRRGNRHLNVIAKNFKGYQNLCALAQKSSLEGTYYDPRIDLELLEQHREGLIITSACFLPNQLVNTANGLKCITQLCLNDSVVGSDGFLHPIKSLTSREYSGNIYTIRPKGHFAKIECTEDHQFLVEDSGVVKWVQAKNIEVDRHKLLSPIIQECPVEFNLWDKVNDFYFWKSRIKGISQTPLYLTPELCLFCGFWLAEGHVSTGGRVGLTFSDKEMKWAKFVQDFLQKQFNLDSNIKVRHDNHRIDVSICSEELNRLLLTYFGKRADGKFISKEFKTANRECRDALLRGVSIGDGSCKGKSFGKYDKFVYASISRSLASDVRDLALSLGIRVTTASNRSHVDTNLVRHRKSYYLFAYGESARKFYSLIAGNSYNTENQDAKGDRTCQFVEFEGDTFFSMPIRSVDVVKGRFDVYCLSEPATESFSVDGVIAHNCLSNVVNWHLSCDRYEAAKQAAGIFQDIFSDDYYLEMMFHGIDSEAKVLPGIQQIGSELGIKTIVTNDCHYVNKEDAEFHEYLMCMSSKRSIRDPKRLKFPFDEFYLKSEEEMLRFFGHCRQSMFNTIEIADKCDYSDIVFGSMRLPKFDLPEGETDPLVYLKKLAWAGLEREHFEKSKPHRDRLTRELDDVTLIWDTKRFDFATYFLIVEDMMRFARENKIESGIRGSGYGSLLLKCLGITEGVDPLEQDLLWERFLGFDSTYFVSEDDFSISRYNSTSEMGGDEELDESDPVAVMSDDSTSNRRI